jgi:hypothetical protein
LRDLALGNDQCEAKAESATREIQSARPACRLGTFCSKQRASTCILDFALRHYLACIGSDDDHPVWRSVIVSKQ